MPEPRDYSVAAENVEGHLRNAWQLLQDCFLQERDELGYTRVLRLDAERTVQVALNIAAAQARLAEAIALLERPQ